VLVFVLILLLLAAIAGVLGAVLKVALVIILAILLTFAILVGGTFWYVRFRLRRLVRHMDRQQRGYPARGYKNRGLPPD
jgi:membrane protein implicated in regulation of membrane protease activity